MRIRGLSRQERWAFGLTTVAVLWAAALVPAALVAPAYGGGGSDGAGGTWTTSATLVQVNGPGVLIPVSIPVALALLAWWILHRRCARGGSDRAAWAITGLLLLFAVVGAMSIGMFVVPVPLLLAFGTSLTPDRRSTLSPG